MVTTSAPTTKRKRTTTRTADDKSISSDERVASSSPTKKMRIVVNHDEEEKSHQQQTLSSSGRIDKEDEKEKSRQQQASPSLPGRSLVSTCSSSSLSSSSSDESPTTMEECSDHDDDSSSNKSIITDVSSSSSEVPLHQPHQTAQGLEKAIVHHVITPQSSMLDLDLVSVKEQDDDISQPDECTVKQPSKAATFDANTCSDTKVKASSVPTTTDSLNESSKQHSYYVPKPLRPFIALMLLLFGGYRIQAGGDRAAVFTGQEDNSICVDGGGFSGFWFTLGRLNSLADPLHNKQYYCYSAGCLGVVAALSNYTKDEMLQIALDKQNRWKDGTLRRYDVVPAFIDDLIHGATNHGSNSSKFLERVQDPRFLSSLNIITSQRAQGRILPGLHASIRTPTTVDDLREMLLQTTWIPFAVGDGFFYDDHMDGAFTIAQHPRCVRRVGLALDVDLLMNAVNVNLAGTKADKFWMAGLEYGL